MLRFECTRCGECCRGPGRARLSVVDVQRLARFLNLAIADFVERYTELVVFVKPGDASEPDAELVLKKAAGACVFLRGDECAVHLGKPDGCRLGPFTYGILGSDRNWAHFQRICPGLDHGPDITWASVRESLETERELRMDDPRTAEEFASQLGLQRDQLPPQQAILLTQDGSLPGMERGDDDEYSSP